jgi:HEAT repeat protein
MSLLALIGLATMLVVAAPAAESGVSGRPLWPDGDGDVARALVARDEGQRLRAVLGLAGVQTPSAKALLLTALRDRDTAVRLTAARLLARRGAREATAAAVSWLGASSANERLLGVLALRDATELPDDARRALERAMRNGDVTTRLAALDVLADHPAASSMAAIIALLEDEISEVRVRSLRALAALRDPRASLAVARRLGDQDRGVRALAASTLGALGDRRVVPALLRQLADASTEPRTLVADALGRLGDGAAVPSLARIARRGPGDELARHATLALGAIGTPDAVEALLELARVPPGSELVRVALQRVGASAVPRLTEELRRGSPTSARLAAEALGGIGDKRATPALVAVVERREEARLVALEALARLADPAAVPALVSEAETGEAPELRVLALQALEAVADSRGVAAIPRALLDHDAGVRAAAARLAGSIGASAEEQALAAHLTDQDVSVRRAAARALDRLRSSPTSSSWPRSPTSAILNALAHGDVAADASTADALGGVLERSATAADASALAGAYPASSPASRVVLARGLAAASTTQAFEGTAVVEALLRDLEGEGSLAFAAAEALAGARPSSRLDHALVAAYARVEDAIRARLAPAMARGTAGARALEATVRDAAAAPSVRAAAAWALGTSSEARGVLEAAKTDADPAVAANARAALSRERQQTGWAAIALATPDGVALPGRWVTIAAGGAPPVWALTDDRGRARVAGLPAAPLVVRLPSATE